MNYMKISSDIGSSLVNNSMKKIFDSIGTADSKIGCIIDMCDRDIAYDIVNKLVYQLDKEKYSTNRYPTMDQDRYVLMSGANYWIKVKTGCDFIHILSYQENMVSKGNSDVWHLKLVIYGPNRKKIREVFYKKILKNKPTKGKIRVTSDSISRNEIRAIPINHVVLDEKIQRYLITSLYHWYKDKKWYSDHHMMHKIGILLYGEPGTGKSTLIRAISNMLGRVDIFMVSGNNLQDEIYRVHRERALSNGLFIVVIEDIDLICKSREECPKDDRYYKDQVDKDQNILFQLLDGALTMENTIFIATTNHKEHLDPALIRHGRFDIQIEMTAFDKDRAVKFVSLFGYKEKDLDAMGITYPITPATLQAKVLEYRANEVKKNDYPLL